MTKGIRYFYVTVGGWLCLVYDNDDKLLGSVHIDKTGAWNIKYAGDTKYLPINSCLNILGYNKKEENFLLE